MGSETVPKNGKTEAEAPKHPGRCHFAAGTHSKMGTLGNDTS